MIFIIEYIVCYGETCPESYFKRPPAIVSQFGLLSFWKLLGFPAIPSAKHTSYIIVHLRTIVQLPN